MILELLLFQITYKLQSIKNAELCMSRYSTKLNNSEGNKEKYILEAISVF